MGTSSAYGGPSGNTPLIPTWLGGEDDASFPGTGSHNDDGGDGPDSNVDENSPSPTPQNQPAPPIPPVADSNRFQAPRTNFTRFANSGGSDRACLGRAVSGYVSSASGGYRQAAQRMGSSRTAGARLAGVLSGVRSQGVAETLRALDLDGLAGKPIEEVFLGLADYVCPEGATVDEGIARNAFIETIADLADAGITDLDSLSVEQMQTVLERYATHAIEARLCNDIGTKISIAPASGIDAARVQEQLRDFILRGVSDALTGARETMEALTPDRTLEFVSDVYEQAFSILQALGEREAEIG